MDFGESVMETWSGRDWCEENAMTPSWKLSTTAQLCQIGCPYNGGPPHKHCGDTTRSTNCSPDTPSCLAPSVTVLISSILVKPYGGVDVEEVLMVGMEGGTKGNNGVEAEGACDVGGGYIEATKGTNEVAGDGED
ncbi:hypothetical protein SESBI_13126 [Sesbania bispinosa]|nr:hypothetical protein SESBI_13126 [Sesbania bispinosa]